MFDWHFPQPIRFVQSSWWRRDRKGLFRKHGTNSHQGELGKELRSLQEPNIHYFATTPLIGKRSHYLLSLLTQGGSFCPGVVSPWISGDQTNLTYPEQNLLISVTCCAQYRAKPFFFFCQYAHWFRWSCIDTGISCSKWPELALASEKSQGCS